MKDTIVKITLVSGNIICRQFSCRGPSVSVGDTKLALAFRFPYHLPCDECTKICPWFQDVLSQVHERTRRQAMSVITTKYAKRNFEIP